MMRNGSSRPTTANGDRERFTADVAVVGGGPSGLIAALALADAGGRTVLFAPETAVDRRTTALLDGSVQTLVSIGVWEALRPQAAPLTHLRLVDATRRLFRAPEVTFAAAELGLPAFGYNIENEPLREGLLAAVQRHPAIRTYAAAVNAVTPEPLGVRLSHPGGSERVRLVAACDGRNSLCRRAAGIAVTRRALSQVAIVVNLRHTRPHRQISTEFHTESGPFTLVPLPGDRSSLVWVTSDRESDGLLRLDDAALAREIERRAQSILGRMDIDGGRGSFPIASDLAHRFSDRRIALIGEAGHVLPPIGAQGLNLGIRDAAALANLVAGARARGADLGGADLLSAYDAQRAPDIRARALAVELMNRSLLTDFLPVHAVRGLGLELAVRFSFFRRRLMQAGLGSNAANHSKERATR